MKNKDVVEIMETHNQRSATYFSRIQVIYFKKLLLAEKITAKSRCLF